MPAQHYVFLRIGAGANSGNELTDNIIPLKATSVDISTSKTIPSLDVPFSGLLTGESVTAALDLGMSSKTVSVTGFILEDTITKKFSKGSSAITRTFTAIEIAQLIHSSVDSTGLQSFQAINELIFLFDSKVDENYAQRTPDGATQLIPFTFSARGEGGITSGTLDNQGVAFPKPFPVNEYSEGLKGFIRSFNTTIDSTTIDIAFTLQFEVASVFPQGNLITKIEDALE
tara:strand:+ start:4608 stop:5294 length:687 start_codon:yes stop_codon:yes gene_type:complete